MGIKLLTRIVAVVCAAVSLMGCVEQQGLSQPTLSKSEISYLERQAQRGDADAQFSLGVLYAEGQSLEKDHAAAVEWFSSAARKGHPKATYNLAHSYFYGQGVSQNYDLAYEYATEAADLGLAMADNLVGVMYERGLGVDQDYDAAFHRYTSAAQQSDAYAQLNLAKLYWDGNGVEKNLKRTLHWTRKAAMQGHAPAQSELAYLLSGEVDGIPQNLDKTFDWAMRAAEQNDGFGHYIVGALYKDGLGVEQDLVVAYMRYLLAERAGFDGGDGRLRPIAEELSVKQLLQAQSLKDECIERNFRDCHDVELAQASSNTVTADVQSDDSRERMLDARAKNHLSCMAAYTEVVSRCSNIAAFKRAAENVERRLDELAESYSVSSPGFFIVPTTADYVEVCVGEETGGVFGNEKAIDRLIEGFPREHDLPNNDAPDEIYDWEAAGLGEEVQKMLDRIYAQPDVDASEWLERTVGRAMGHAQHAKQLLAESGFSDREILDLITEYERSGGDDLIGDHPEDQNVPYKIKACLELMDNGI